MRRYRLLREDEDNGPQWVATYTLTNTEYDDTLEDEDTIQVYLNAVDFEHAVRYAQQYLRKQQLEDSSWANADIISVELY